MSKTGREIGNWIMREVGEISRSERKAFSKEFLKEFAVFHETAGRPKLLISVEN